MILARKLVVEDGLLGPTILIASAQNPSHISSSISVVLTAVLFPSPVSMGTMIQ